MLAPPPLQLLCQTSAAASANIFSGVFLAESFYTRLSGGAGSCSASEQHLQQQFCPCGSRSVLKGLLWKLQATAEGAMLLQLSLLTQSVDLKMAPSGLCLVFLGNHRASHQLEVPTAPGITAPSCPGSGQVEEQLRRRSWVF